jgi:Sulfite exporter TauE/SafE
MNHSVEYCNIDDRAVKPPPPSSQPCCYGPTKLHPSTDDKSSGLSLSTNRKNMKWRQLQRILFLLAVPSLVMGRIDAGQYEFTSKNNQNKINPKGTTSSSSSLWMDILGFWKSYSNTHQIQKIYESNPHSSSASADLIDDAFSDRNNNDLDRNLKSHDSNSRDSHDEHDDFWRNPDYWDDFNHRDDDFYKYERDPTLPSLLPLTRRDVIGFMLASLGATLGSSAGIGGGGLVVPCYIIAIGLSPKQAFPIGSVTVVGGALAALMLNLRRRHPLADRPIIDWDLILVMEPLVLMGAIFGSILHRVVPEKILSVLLVLLLSTVAHTTLRKARRMFDAERRYIEHLKTARSDYLSRVASFRTVFRMSEAGWSADALPGIDPESKTVSASYLPPTPVRTQSLDSRSMNTTTPLSPRMNAYERQRILILNPDFVTLRSDLLEEEKMTPRSKVMALCAKFSVLMFLNLTLGGGKFRSPWGIECGGIAFFVVHVIMIAFLISSAWAAQVRKNKS